MNRRTGESSLARIKQLPPERRAQFENFVDFLAAQERRREAGEALRAMWAKMPQEEVATPYSITWSARTKTDCGTFIPSAFAVLRFRTVRNTETCSTGSSAGFAPFRIRCT